MLQKIDLLRILYSAYHSHWKFNQQAKELKSAIVLQSNGDYITNCYLPDKDIVIPPVTRLVYKMKKTIGDLNNILPSEKRPFLFFFRGGVSDGTGTGNSTFINWAITTYFSSTKINLILHKFNRASYENPLITVSKYSTRKAPSPESDI